MSIKKMLRPLVESLLPHVVHRRFVRVATPREKELQLLPALVPSDGLCLDVGANRGLYVEHLLLLTKSIVVFEPVPSLQVWLRRIFGHKVKLMPYALSDRAGNFDIRYPKGNYSWATLSATNVLEKADTAICTTSVQVRTLDSFDLKNIAFIKIDVEGHEEAVVAGAHKTIATSRPNFLIEVEDRHNRGATSRIRALFVSLGYKGAFIADGTLKDISEFDVTKDQNPDNVSTKGKVGRYINNFLFFPSEKAESITAQISDLLSGRNISR